MRTVRSSEEPTRVSAWQLRDGSTLVYMHDNITEVDDGWEADEVSARLNGIHGVDAIEAAFSRYWRMCERASATDIEILASDVAETGDAVADLSEVTSESADAIAELSELVSELIGGMNG